MVFKSLTLRTLKSGLETMVTEPCGVQTIGTFALLACQDISKQSQMQAQKYRSLSAQEQSGWLVCLILRSNFALLLQRVLNNSCGGKAFIAAVFDSLVKHITPFLMVSCVSARTLGLSSSGKTFRF